MAYKGLKGIGPIMVTGWIGIGLAYKGLDDVPRGLGIGLSHCSARGR